MGYQTINIHIYIYIHIYINISYLKAICLTLEVLNF